MLTAVAPSSWHHHDGTAKPAVRGGLKRCRSVGVDKDGFHLEFLAACCHLCSLLQLATGLAVKRFVSEHKSYVDTISQLRVPS